MGFMGLMVVVDEGFRKIQLVTPIIFVQSLRGIEITKRHAQRCTLVHPIMSH